MRATKDIQRRKTANDVIVSAFNSSDRHAAVQLVSLSLSPSSDMSTSSLTRLIRKGRSIPSDPLNACGFYEGERVLRSHPYLGFSRGKIGTVSGTVIRFDDEILRLTDANPDKFMSASVIEFDQAQKHHFNNTVLVWEQGARRYGEALRRLLLQSSGRLTVIEVAHQYRFKTFSVDLFGLSDREKARAMESALHDFARNSSTKRKGVVRRA